MSTLMNSRQRLLLALLILLVDYSTAAAIPSLPEHIPPAANPHTVNEPSEAYQHWRPYKEDTPWYVNFTWTNIFVMIFCSWGWCLSRCILVRVEGLARMRASQAEDEASCRRKAEDPEAPEPERSEMTRSVDGSASFQARAMINSAAGEGPSNIDGTFDSTAVLPARFLLVPAGVVKTCSPTDILTPGPSGPPLGKQNGYFNDWMDESARERIAEQRSHAARIRAREMEVDEDGTNLQLM